MYFLYDVYMNSVMARVCNFTLLLCPLPAPILLTMAPPPHPPPTPQKKKKILDLDSLSKFT